MTDAPVRTWWSATEIAEAALPDLPNTKQGINDLARRDGWANCPGKARRRKGRGGGLEYHYTLFPVRARVALLAANRVQDTPQRLSREAAWTLYDGLPDLAKVRAANRLRAVCDVEELEAAGLTRTESVREIAIQCDISEKTLWNWLGLVEGVASEDRVAHLAPRSGGPKGKRKADPVDPDFFALIKSDFLRLEQPSFTACYDRAVRIAQREGMWSRSRIAGRPATLVKRSCARSAHNKNVASRAWSTRSAGTLPWPTAH